MRPAETIRSVSCSRPRYATALASGSSCTLTSIDRRKNFAGALRQLRLDADAIFEVPAELVQAGHRDDVAGWTRDIRSCQPGRYKVWPLATSKKIGSSRMQWSDSSRSWVSKFLESSSDLLTHTHC